MIQFQILIDLDLVVLRGRHDILGVKGHGCDFILVADEVAEPADRSSARAASLSCKGSRPRRRLLESAKDGLLQIRRAPLLHPLLGRGPVHHGGFFVLRHSYPLIGGFPLSVHQLFPLFLRGVTEQCERLAFSNLDPR